MGEIMSVSLFKRILVAAATIGLIGVVSTPISVKAAAVTITITDTAGTPIPRAFVVALNAEGDAVDSAISGTDGTTSINDAGASGLIVSAPGYQTKTSSSSAAQTVQLTASTKSKLNFANAYGGQIRTIAADGESGVFYATSDAQPSVWRTSDFGGTWAPVPTSADVSAATASAEGGMPQESAGEIFTSGTKGEVAVQVGQALYFSRNYGNTWTSISNYGQVTGNTQNNAGSRKKHSWVHGGATGEYSYIFVETEAKLFAAIIPDSTSDTSPAAFAEVTSTITRYSSGDRVAFAVGNSGDMFMATVNGTGTLMSKFTTFGPGVSDIRVGEASLPQATHVLGTAGIGLIKLSTLGEATPQAFVTHVVDNATVSVSVGALVGGTWTVSTGVEGTNSDNSITFGSISSLSGNCGQNGTTPLVASIAPNAPGGGEILAGIEVVGTIGQCMFAFNASGATSIGGQSVTVGKVGLLAMSGANNNTGFVWDSGFNFDTNMVTLTGDGQFGLRKSASISSTTSYRPNFGTAGSTQALSFIERQAGAGTGADSGGIAVNGMTAPNVTDIAYGPNSSDGSQLVVGMTETGGSRTLLSTDGGTSFSTLGAGGSRAVEWWNGAGGVQHIAAGFTNNPSEFLHVKSFNTTSGTGKLEMGDELAATAAERDSKIGSSRKEFSFPGAANPVGSTLSPSNFVSGGGSNLLVAIEGIAGKDMMFVAVNKCTGNAGPTGCESSAGSVAMIGVSANSSTGSVTLSNVKYFGAEVAAAGATSAGTATYAGAVKAIQYCPTGSATRVADSAFISVGGKGIYKIGAVTSSPLHEATSITTGTYSDLKIDCDTGLMVAAGSDGLYFSVDGKSFIKMNTATAAGAGAPQPQGGAPTAVAVKADATTGEVTMVVASGDGDVKSVETTFTDLGTTGAAVAGGTATTPTTPVQPPSSTLNELNSASTGIKTGQVQDVEFPTSSGDKVGAASVRTSGVRKMATSAKMSAGTGGGAFRGTVTPNTSGGAVGTTPAVTTPAVTTPAVTTPAVTQVSVAKTPNVGTGKGSSLTTLAKNAGMTVASKATVTATVASASKAICKVSGSKLVGLAPGKCSIKVKVTPKGAKGTSKSVNLNITGTPTVKRGSSLTFTNGAAAAGLTVSSGSRISVTIAASSKTSCKVSGSKIVGLKASTCKTQIGVTSADGTSVSKALNIKVR